MLHRTTITALLVGACSHPMPEPIAAHATEAPAAHDPRVVLDYMRIAVEARDPHAVAALYADDAVFEFAGTRTVRGRAAIEAMMRDAFAPAESIRIGFPRLWIKGDVAIAEAVFHATHPASSGMHDVGESEVMVLAFDANGRIAHEQVYANQSMLESQADGDPDAEPVPAIPTTTEVHVAAANANDAALIAWANAAEATFSHDEVDASLIDEHAAWDCSLGFHGTNRAQLEKAYVKWQKAFPTEKLTPTHVWAVDDYVIIEETFSGVLAGDLGDIPATHREVTWKWLKIWRVDHGKIMRGWQWGDWKELEAQITTPAHPKHKPACSIES